MKLNRIAARLTLTFLAAAAASVRALAAGWVVGANNGNVPWEFQDASGKFVAFEIDLVNEVAKVQAKPSRLKILPSTVCFRQCNRVVSRSLFRPSPSPPSGRSHWRLGGDGDGRLHHLADVPADAGDIA